MTSERLLHAPDLVTRNEYETLAGGRKLKARVYSSKQLGLEEREEVALATVAAQPVADEVVPTARRGRRSEASNEEGKE